MSRDKGYITAAELMAELDADPEYQAGLRELNERIERETRALNEDAAPVLHDLHEIGIEIESIWDLVNTSDDYHVAYPVLVAHIDRPYMERNREALIRSLTRVDAVDCAWVPLRELFKANGSAAPEGIGFALGNALGEIMDENVLPDVLELVADRTYGTNREVMVHYLVEYRDRPEVCEVLESLVDDPDVSKHARRALTLRRVRRRPGRSRRRKR